MDPTLILAGIIAIAIAWIIHSLGRGTWKCPACDFQTWSEEEAVGYQATHAQHRPTQEY